MKINEEYIEKIAASLRESRKNLVNFRKINLDIGIDECDPAQFHFYWSKSLLNGFGNEAIEGFRESAKGQYVLRSFPLYALTFPTKRLSYIVIVKNTSTLAENKLLEIQDEFLGNKLLSARVVRVNRRSGKVFDVDIKNDEGEIINILMEAYGKGASIRGLSKKERRPNIVIIDDPQDLADSESDVTLDKDWKWFMSDVFFLGQHCRIFLIGNNLGEKCIIERVFADPEALGFNTSRVPIMIEYDDGREPQSNWPAKYSIEAINKEKEAFRKVGELPIWIRERMCLAASDETRMFKKKWFKYFTASLIPNLRQVCNPFLTIDPAFSERETSDFRALVLNLVNDKNQWFIAEVSCGVYDMNKLVDEIFRFVRGYNLLDVYVEEGFAKVLEKFIEKEMIERKCFFNIVYLKHGGRAKQNRIKTLQPRFRAGRIFFPHEADWLTEMESELLAYTIHGSKGLRDDVIDALAYQVQCAEAPYNSGTSGGAPLPRSGETMQGINEVRIMRPDAQQIYEYAGYLPREGST